MSLALLGVRYKGDKRDRLLQHGSWVLKLGLWIVFSALPFFFPNGVIWFYGARRSCRTTLKPFGTLWTERETSIPTSSVQVEPVSNNIVL